MLFILFQMFKLQKKCSRCICNIYIYIVRMQYKETHDNHYHIFAIMMIIKLNFFSGTWAVEVFSKILAFL